MAIRLITYDLNKERSKKFDYDGFYKFIKNHAWARLSESSYAIETNASPSAIFSQLQSYVDENDHVLVMTLTSPFYGQHKQEVLDWLQERLQIG